MGGGGGFVACDVFYSIITLVSVLLCIVVFSSVFSCEGEVGPFRSFCGPPIFNVVTHHPHPAGGLGFVRCGWGGDEQPKAPTRQRPCIMDNEEA